MSNSTEVGELRELARLVITRRSVHATVCECDRQIDKVIDRWGELPEDLEDLNHDGLIDLDRARRQLDDALKVVEAARAFATAWANPSDRSPWVAKKRAFHEALDLFDALP